MFCVHFKIMRIKEIFTVNLWVTSYGGVFLVDIRDTSSEGRFVNDGSLSSLTLLRSMPPKSDYSVLYIFQTGPQLPCPEVLVTSLPSLPRIPSHKIQFRASYTPLRPWRSQHVNVAEGGSGTSGASFGIAIRYVQNRSMQDK